MIHVMAATGLAGATVPAPVVGYDAIAVLEEEQHLCVPIVGRQRPTVAEHDRLSGAPILVVDLGPIGGGDRRHVIALGKGDCDLELQKMRPAQGRVEVHVELLRTRYKIRSAGCSAGWS